MTTLLRPSTPACLTVEDLIGRISDLVLARQSMRTSGADELMLEQNRQDLVTAHWELSHALIERHCVQKPDAEAAAA
jgi:hypothetical protein